MKINELRTLIREEIQNELAEAKKKKKKEAKEKIMEIITEAELTEEELEEIGTEFFKKVGDTVKKFGDKAEKVKAKIGLGEYPTPKGPHEATKEAIKGALLKSSKQLLDAYKKQAGVGSLDDLVKYYQNTKGEVFDKARYWIQAWYDAKENPSANEFQKSKGAKIWKNADTSNPFNYLPTPKGQVGLATKASGEGGSGTNFGE